MLDSTWKLYIFHGNNNEHLVKNINAKKFNINSLTWAGYSNLLCSKEFWLKIPHEKILIFQHDSGLLKKGICEFLEWDWIGTPSWWGGYNGGLTIRSRSKTLEILNRFHYQWESEDFYYHRNMQKIGAKVAPLDIASKFGCERFKLGTLGYHGIHNFLNTNQQHTIKTQYLKLY